MDSQVNFINGKYETTNEPHVKNIQEHAWFLNLKNMLCKNHNPKLLAPD